MSLNTDISKDPNPDPVIANFLKNASSGSYFEISRPITVQILKVYNVGQPKINQKSHGSRLLRFSMQEAGGAKINAIEYEYLGAKLSLDTASGVKVELKGKILYGMIENCINLECTDVRVHSAANLRF